MAQTSTFCLAQQSLQQARAMAATLPNVRKVALVAAKAWGREAELAANVERRRAGGAPESGDAAIMAEFEAEAAAERRFASAPGGS